MLKLSSGGNMNNYKRLLLYAKPYSGRLMLAFLFTSVAAAGNLFVPWILKDVIDKVLMNKDIFLLNTGEKRPKHSINGNLGRH